MREGAKPLVIDWQLHAILHRERIAGPTELAARLAEIDIHVSVAQLCRLIKKRPARVSLTLLGGLCTVLDCAPADLLLIYHDPLRQPPSPRLLRYSSPPRVGR